MLHSVSNQLSLYDAGLKQLFQNFTNTLKKLKKHGCLFFFNFKLVFDFEVHSCHVTTYISNLILLKKFFSKVQNLET